MGWGERREDGRARGRFLSAASAFSALGGTGLLHLVPIRHGTPNANRVKALAVSDPHVRVRRADCPQRTSTRHRTRTRHQNHLTHRLILMFISSTRNRRTLRPLKAHPGSDCTSHRVLDAISQRCDERDESFTCVLDSFTSESTVLYPHLRHHRLRACGPRPACRKRRPRPRGLQKGHCRSQWPRHRRSQRKPASQRK